MLGGTGLTRSATAARMASTRLTALRSSRSLSSIASRSFRNPVSLGKTISGNASWKPVSSASRLSFARFNSTSTTAAASPAATTTTTADAAQTGSTDVADLSALDIEQIPEQIGYLKELGLDYGWGPSSLMQWVIEHIHIWTGLPWWASIVATGILVRLAVLKPAIDASDLSARLHAVRDISNPLRQRMLRYARDGNQVELVKARAELQDLNIKHGIKPSKAFVPLLVNVPLSYGCFRVVRGMAALPVPGLASESLGWITDLTVSDPYFVIPLATSAVLYLSMRKGGDAGLNHFQEAAFGKVFLYGLPVLSFLFMAFFPSALQLYFASTGLFAIGQSYLLNHRDFRKWAGMAPLPQHKSSNESVATRRLRLIEDSVRAEVSKAAKEQLQAGSQKSQISIIDRVVNGFSDGIKNLRQEVVKQAKELSGGGSDATGSPAGPPPRLSQADLQKAQEYDRRRQEEEEYKRQERNHARREAFMRALEAEREKAARMYRSKDTR